MLGRPSDEGFFGFVFFPQIIPSKQIATWPEDWDHCSFGQQSLTDKCFYILLFHSYHTICNFLPTGGINHLDAGETWHGYYLQCSPLAAGSWLPGLTEHREGKGQEKDFSSNFPGLRDDKISGEVS